MVDVYDPATLFVFAATALVLGTLIGVGRALYTFWKYGEGADD